MRRLAQVVWPAVIAAALATGVSACGSTAKPANNTPPASTNVSPGGASSTTLCTIPQNNGGDHDSDNNGGPNDGDGCDV